MKPQFFTTVSALLLLTAVGLRAQASGSGSTTTGNDTASPATPPDIAEQRQLIAAAKAAAESGSDAASVEAGLVVLDVSQPGTAEWFMETAQRLVEVAGQVARDGAKDPVPGLANRALQDLAIAEQKAPDAEAHAAAKCLEGFIEERYLGDNTAALASYQAAAQLAPDNTAAKEAARRLSGAADNVQQKIGGG